MTHTSNIGLCSIAALLVASNLAIADKNVSRLGPADHPTPGTTIVRFGEVAPGVYRGSKPHTDADFRFLQSKHIRYDLDIRFLPLARQTRIHFSHITNGLRFR